MSAEMKLGENISRLRKQARITQEELADFLGVTKASVSKWETGQSFPDLLLLPRIAAYFDVTLDDLMGYQPQLTRQQIRKLHQELSEDFLRLPFEDAIEKCRTLTKKYYSCYPFLYQIGLLWINHVSLAPTPQRQTEILRETIRLYDRICAGSSDTSLLSDSRILKALVLLWLGNPGEARRLLEPAADPLRLQHQSGSMLIQACQMLGEMENARSISQIQCYLHLMQLFSMCTSLLALEKEDFEKGMETIRRTRSLMEVWHLEHLMTNQAAVFSYQSALFYCFHGKTSEALAELKNFVHTSLSLCRRDLHLEGDDYFTRISDWFDQSLLGNLPPRSPGLIPDNLLAALDSPALAVLSHTPEFHALKEQIKKARGSFQTPPDHT